MIVASIAEPTPLRVLERMDEARRQGADVAEIRGDALEKPDLGPILSGKALPIIVTIRPTWEGGKWTGSEEDRIALLGEAGRAGAEYVDVEFKAYKDFDRGRASLILSWHDFEKTPADVGRIAEKMKGLAPKIIKIAVRANGTADLVAMAELQKRMERPSAVIAMGDWGEPLRILYRKFGGALTYASIGEATAPGQLSVSELVQMYRVKTIDPSTEVYGVFGNPVAHSQGPRVFNQVFRDLGRNARYVRVRLDEAARFRDVARALELRGASVTIPHKESILGVMDEVDPRAQGIGAANTVVIGEGRLSAYNTDVLGAVEAIAEAAKRKWSHGVYGLRALVLGAGGAARAIAWGLLREGARVTLANRTFDRAKALAESLRCDYLSRERLLEARAQVVVNATSVGMDGSATPFPKELWKKEMVAFDSVYTPRNTPFLKDARAAGAEVVDGVDFFLRQANHQMRHFIGRAMPTEVYKEFGLTL